MKATQTTARCAPKGTRAVISAFTRALREIPAGADKASVAAAALARLGEKWGAPGKALQKRAAKSPTTRATATRGKSATPPRKAAPTRRRSRGNGPHLSTQTHETGQTLHASGRSDHPTV